MSSQVADLDPTPRDVAFRLGGASYTLREPTTGEYAKLVGALERAIRVGPDGRPVGVVFGYAGDAVCRHLRDAEGALVSRDAVGRWPSRVVRDLFVRLIDLSGAEQVAPAPLYTGALYVWCIAFWAREMGYTFPAMAARIRSTLADPDTTEADYADLIGEVNRTGGPKIGIPAELPLAMPMPTEKPEDDLPWGGPEWDNLSPQTRHLLRHMNGRESDDLVNFIDVIWEKDNVSPGAINTAISRANHFLSKQNYPRTLEKVRGERTIRWV